MTRDLRIVAAAMLTWGIGEGMFYIFQPLYIQEFGAEPILIGTILGVNGLMMTAAQIPAGYLADRFGRRPLMWFSWICGVIATWMMALAPSLWVFVAAMLLYGITSSVLAPLYTYVQGARGSWSVGKAVTFASSAFHLGGILGPILGGILGEALNLRSVYFVAAGVFTLSTIIIFFAKHQPIEDHFPQPGETYLLKNRRFLSLLPIIFLVMVATTLPQPLTANFLQNERSFSLARIGQLGSLGALGSVGMMLLFGHVPAGVALVIGQAGVFMFALLLWQGQGLVWYGLAYLFLGGYRLGRTMTVALIRPVVRAKEVGLAFGIVESLNSLALVAAPVLAGLLYEWQPIAVYPITLIALVVAIALSWRLIRPGQNDLIAPIDVPLVDVEVEDAA